MKLKLIEARHIPPINQFYVDNLSNVVVLAGHNGVGKTRLTQGFLQALRHPSNYPNIRFVIEATTKQESTQWGKSTLDTALAEDHQKLLQTL